MSSDAAALNTGAAPLAQDDAASIADQLKWLAALRGSFDPLNLIEEVESLQKGEGSARLADRALNRLSRSVDEIISADGTHWRLNADARHAALAEMVKAGKLRAMLSKTPDDPKDQFGRLLRSALLAKGARGAPKRLRTLDPAGLMDWALALDFAERTVGDRSAPGITNPRIELARRAEDARLEHVAPRDKFFGRAEISKALVAYALERKFEPPLRQLSRDRKDASFVRPVLVTGIGGSGKSALVANLVRRLKRLNWTGSVVVTLDFDRPSLALGGEREWLAEVTRQIARARPALADRLSKVRVAGRRILEEYLREYGSMERLPATHQLNVVATMRNKLKEALAESDLNHEPLIIVLDTFEEVMVRSDMGLDDQALERELFGLVLAFLDSLDDLGGRNGPLFGSVRGIVAGRIRPFSDDDRRLGQWFDSWFEVEELEPAAAVRLLRDRAGPTLNQKRARQIAGMFPRFPLVLILVASFIAGDKDAPLEDILAEGGLGQLNAERATQALYKRFLDRVPEYRETDPGGLAVTVPQSDLRRVAQPGLALPFITSQLIQEVLADPCGLGEVDRKRAGLLFRGLSKTAWLVEPAGPDRVRHVPALRRIMLPMLASDSTADADGHPIKARFRAVHDAAARWYREGGASEPEAAARAAYHDCFRGDVTTIKADPLMRRRVLDLAGDDVHSMPAEARALLILEKGRSSALTSEDLAVLPRDMRRQAELERRTSRTKRGLVDEQQPLNVQGAGAEAVSAAPTLGALRSFGEILNDTEVASAVETSFAAADFEAVCAIAWPNVAALAAAAQRAFLTPNWNHTNNLEGLWIWKWAISALTTGNNREDIDPWCRTIGNAPLEASFSGPGFGHFTLALMIATVALGRAPSFLAQAPYFEQVARFAELGSSDQPINTLTDARLRQLLPLWTGLTPAVPPPFKLSVAVARLVGLAVGFDQRTGSRKTRFALAVMFDPPESLRVELLGSAFDTQGSGDRRKLTASNLLSLLRNMDRGEAFLRPIRGYSNPAGFALPYEARVGDRLPEPLLPAYGILLRGPTPELYDPIRTALVDVVRASPDTLVNAIGNWEGRALYWPEDFSAPVVQNQISKSRSADFALAQLIGVLDLNGLLSAFLMTCSEALPMEQRLQAVTRALRVYDKLLLEHFDAIDLVPSGLRRDWGATPSSQS
ncbi:hypothetical protein ABB55_14380 [Prosthecomicrobium hirschii]|uniref:Orc1-like AAA ATPase domain-containing protein n=1 Tax=Prosthecodimorpha hirschii TaxID=665126 RepID=A0A0P6W487_9HYPH|nr:ATP-binding protein [Prosthecomicrobium hirschii]KPL53252.1 hypothetical protein ABB55_14380 [Prosthecomicrobium hirschii]